MPPSTEKNIIASGRPPSKKKPVVLILVIIAVVLLVAGAIYAWTIFNAKQQQEAKVKATSAEIAEETLKKQEATRETIYATPAYDESAEQRFSNLRGKAITAQSANEWQLAVTYTNESLAITGYENDLGSLIRLAEAYKQLNQTDNRIATLKKIKAVYEGMGQTDNDDYRAIVKEIG